MNVDFNILKCDWYSMTFMDSSGLPLSDDIDFQLDFCSKFTSDLSFIFSEVGILSFNYLDKGLHGYNSQIVVSLAASPDVDPVRIGTILYSGSTKGMSIHFFVTSFHADVFRQFLINLFNNVCSSVSSFEYLNFHKCTRIDLAYDLYFQSSEEIDSFFDLVRDHAISKRLKTALAGDWDYKKGGRSYYVGSPSSDFRFCVYEKGIEQLNKKNISCDSARGWVRVELRLKGRRGMQFAIPSSSLLLVANASKATRDFYSAVIPDLPVSELKLFRFPSVRKNAVDRVVSTFVRSRKALKEVFNSYCFSDRNLFLDFINYALSSAFSDYDSVEDFEVFLSYGCRGGV